MIKRLPAEEETKVIEQLQQLAKQDGDLQLPPSLRSSALLETLQEQPNLVSMEGGLLTRKRTMYVVSTCAAAFVMVIGLVKVFPLMSKSDSLAAAPSALSSSAAMAMAVTEAAEEEFETDFVSNYDHIAEALSILNGTAVSDEEENLNEPKTVSITAASGTVKAEAPDSDMIPAEEEVFEESETVAETVAEETEEPLMLASAPGVLSGAAGASGDLVTASGEWVFWLEQDSTATLHLINSQTMEEEASVSLPEASMISELASYSNMLVCIDPYTFTSDEAVPGVTVYLYQLGEDKTASLLNTISVSGTFDQSYLNSDGVLFLASNQLLDLEAANHPDNDLSDVLPKVFNDQYQDEAEPLPVENIAVIDTPVDPNYLNITAIDLANGGTSCTWSLLGRQGTITISDNIMQMITPDGEGGTQLISIDFSGNTVQYRISKSIPEN